MYIFSTELTFIIHAEGIAALKCDAKEKMCTHVLRLGTELYKSTVTLGKTIHFLTSVLTASPTISYIYLDQHFKSQKTDSETVHVWPISFMAFTRDYRKMR